MEEVEVLVLVLVGEWAGPGGSCLHPRGVDSFHAERQGVVVFPEV